jgi:hypothetical protein
VKLPAEDRIFTITEGKGITGALCGGKPVRTQIGRQRKQHKPIHTRVQDCRDCFLAVNLMP